MKETCLFCRIIAKDEKSFIVFEDENFISFLDKRPLFPGHSLLLPKLHVNTIYDLPKNLSASIVQHTKLVGKAIENAMQSEGSFIALNNIVSQSVPHLHIHLVPRNKGDGLKGFFWPRNKYESEEHMSAIQKQIQDEIKQLEKELN